MYTVLLVVDIMVALSMILLILVQRSEGGALGMGGGSGFVTGRGAANLLTRMTAVLAAIFFATSLALGTLSHRVTPTSAVGVPVSNDASGPIEKAPEGLPEVKLPKRTEQAPPAQAPAPASPSQPQLPQSQ